MAQIKKTMVEALEFVKAHGNMSKENLETFIKEFCEAKSGSSNGPRELTILKDGEGNILGRKDTVIGLWYPIDRFSKGTTVIKEVDAVRGKLYAESKKMEKEAQKLLEEAKDITDIQEKVAKYEEFDKALEAAKAHRTQPIDILPEWKEGGFETMEELAQSLA